MEFLLLGLMLLFFLQVSVRVFVCGMLLQAVLLVSRPTGEVRLVADAF